MPRNSVLYLNSYMNFIAYEDQKVLSAVEERRRMDTIRFQKAGTGPIPRTYSYDPTKPRPSNVASTANKSMAAKHHET